MRTKVLFSLIILSITSLLLVNAVYSERSNVLVNPGFEEGRNEWYNWNFGENSAEITSKHTYNGNNAACLHIFGEGQGCFGQILPISCDQTIEASVWVMNPSSEALTDNAEAYLRIEFWDERAPLERGHVESIHLNKPSKWIKVEVSGTAPYGTKEARVLGFVRGNNNSSKGKAYFDDFKVNILND